MPNDLFEFRKELTRQGIFFSFSGPFSQDLLVEIGAILRRKMELKDANNLTIIRVFSMVVELAQNIIHYSAERFSGNGISKSKEDLSLGIITVGYESDHYFVACGNMIYKDARKKLQDRLTNLQEMNKEELRKHYKKRRKAKPEEGSKGAGLGFIEMAKKASEPIDFSISEIDEDHSFFSIRIII